MEREIDLIACDVDGTLLFDYAPALPPSTLDVIGQLVDRGFVFVPASGRSFDSLRRLFGPLAEKMPIIANNGTIAYLGGEVVFRSCMDRALGDELIDTMLASDECEALVTGARTSYMQPKSPDFITFMSETLGFDITIVDDLKAVDEPYTKVSAYFPSRVIDERRWADRFGDRCSIVTAGFGWLDAMPLGTSKARALLAVLEQLDVAPARVMALGDARNDLEMLQLAGVSIAMQDGDARVIAAATRVAANAETELRKLLRA